MSCTAAIIERCVGAKTKAVQRKPAHNMRLLQMMNFCQHKSLGPTTMLTDERLAGVAPKVNLRNGPHTKDVQVRNLP